MSLICERCELSGHKKYSDGGGNKPYVLFVIDAPYKSDSPDITQTYIAKYIKDLFYKNGFKDNELYFTYAVKCLRQDDKPVTKQMLDNCRPYLHKTIFRADPKVVVSLGGAATYGVQPAMMQHQIYKIHQFANNVSMPNADFPYWLMCWDDPTILLKKPHASIQFEGVYMKTFLRHWGKGREEISFDGEFQFIKVDTLDKLDNMIADLKDKVYSFDIETTGLDLFKDDIVCMSFSKSPKTAYWLPLNVNDKEYWGNGIIENEIKPRLRILFDCKDDIVAKGPVVHNETFEAPMMRRWGIENFEAHSDTAIMAHIENENLGFGNYKLKRLISRYPDLSGYGDDIIFDTLIEIPEEKLMTYNCKDADATIRLYYDMMGSLKTKTVKGGWGQYQLLTYITMPARRTLTRMEMLGISVDTHKIATLKELWKTDLKEHETKAKEISQNKQLNINSDKEIGNVLYNYLKLPVLAKTEKRGQPKTDANTLKLLLKYDKTGFVRAVMDYNNINTLIVRYLKGIEESINSVTGRVHTNYLSMGTVSGRLSSYNPNLQNIPRDEDPLGMEIKRIFIPSNKDNIFIEMDYAQLEYRIALAFAPDNSLIQRLWDGEDFHKITASMMFGVPADEVTKPQRSVAKSIVFGLLYGMGVASLASTIGCSKEDAQGKMDLFFSKLPQFKVWMDSVIKSVKRNKEVKSLFGRVRHLPEIDHSIKGISLRAERQAVNFPVQSTASDLCMYSLSRIERRLKDGGYKTVPLLTVHDSIMFEGPDVEADAVIKILKDQCENPDNIPKIISEKNIPIKIDIKKKRTWGDYV